MNVIMIFYFHKLFVSVSTLNCSVRFKFHYILKFLKASKSSGKLIFWLPFILKGILAESLGEDSNEHVFTLVESMVDTSKNGGNNGSCEEILVGDDEGERSTASVEDQLRKEMTVYEVCGFMVTRYIVNSILIGWNVF